MAKNYIQTLQEENKRLRNNRRQVFDEITDFIGFLHSDKFKGTGCDGSRKDWISTKDVINRLQEIRNELIAE